MYYQEHCNDSWRTWTRLETHNRVEQTPHTLPWQASYGVSVLRILEKTNCVISYNGTTLYFDVYKHIWAQQGLTHWGWVSHIWVSKITIIGSDDGLSPGQRHVIIWSNAGIFVNWTLGNKLQWNFHRNQCIFIQENAFENVCEMTAILSQPQCVNSLWPRDVIWWQGSRSTLAQVMACCLTAPSHHLNQCWPMISEVLWHSPDSNFTENT